MSASPDPAGRDRGAHASATISRAVATHASAAAIRWAVAVTLGPSSARSSSRL